MSDYNPLFTVQQLIDALQAVPDKNSQVRMTIHLDPQYPTLESRYKMSPDRPSADPYVWVDGIVQPKNNSLFLDVVLYGGEC